MFKLQEITATSTTTVPIISSPNGYPEVTGSQTVEAGQKYW
jgi:hypothetical protein